MSRLYEFCVIEINKKKEDSDVLKYIFATSQNQLKGNKTFCDCDCMDALCFCYLTDSYSNRLVACETGIKRLTQIWKTHEKINFKQSFLVFCWIKRLWIPNPYFLIFTLHLHPPKPMNLKRILSWESERKADITMLIATVPSSKYQEMENFLSPFNTVAPSRHIQNHFVLLFHAHECKARDLVVTNLRP